MIKLILLKVSEVHKTLDLQKIGRALIYLNVFLLPLILFNSNSGLLEFGKNIFFFSIALALLLIIAVDIYRSKNIEISYTKIDKLATAFLIAYILATIFSKDRYVSLLGNGLDFGLSLVMICALAVYYFSSKYLIKNLKQVKVILSLVAVSSVLIGLYEVAGQVFKFGLPQIYSGLLSMTILWTVIGFASCLAFIHATVGKIQRVYCVLVTLLLLINVFFDFTPALIAILLILFASLGQLSKMGGKKTGWIIALMSLVTVIIIFPVRAWLHLPNLFEISLPFFYGMQIGWATIKDSLPFGFGPHNFETAFNLFRPAEFNYNLFWSYSFRNAGQFIWQILITTGVIGTLSLLILFLTPIFTGFKKIKNLLIDQPQKNFLQSLLALILILLLSFFIFTVNLNLLVFTVMLLSLISIFIYPKEMKIYTLSTTIRGAILYGAIVLSFVALYYLYPMKLTLAQAISYSSRPDAIGSELINKFQQSNKYNVTDAQGYLNQTSLMLNDKASNKDSVVTVESVDTLIESAMNSGINRPSEVSAIRDVAATYAQVFGADKYNVANWDKKYIDYSPNDPQGYFIRASRLLSALQSLKSQSPEEFTKVSQSGVFENIENDLKKAIELKNDYAPAINAYGILEVLKSDHVLAKQYFAQALNINPQEKTYLLNFLSVLSTAEEKQLGLQIIEKYLIDNPQDQELLQVKEEFISS